MKDEEDDQLEPDTFRMNRNSSEAKQSVKVYTVNHDGVVLLPEYMAKAVMNNEDDDALDVTEVKDIKPKKQKLKVDPLYNQSFEVTKGSTMKEKFNFKSYPNSDDEQIDNQFRCNSDRSPM